jgi:hypothetical protein
MAFVAEMKLPISEYPQVGTRRIESSSKVMENSGVETATKKAGTKMIRALEMQEELAVWGGGGHDVVVKLDLGMALTGAVCAAGAAAVIGSGFNPAVAAGAGGLCAGVSVSGLPAVEVNVSQATGTDSASAQARIDEANRLETLRWIYAQSGGSSAGDPTKIVPALW